MYEKHLTRRERRSCYQPNKDKRCTKRASARHYRRKREQTIMLRRSAGDANETITKTIIHSNI